MALRNISPYGLRFPQELRDAVQARADNQSRSLQSQILWELARYPELEELTKEQEERILALESQVRALERIIDRGDELKPFVVELMRLYDQMRQAAKKPA